jgi:predicted naringenin-chalcone synthase
LQCIPYIATREAIAKAARAVFLEDERRIAIQTARQAAAKAAIDQAELDVIYQANIRKIRLPGIAFCISAAVIVVAVQFIK